METIERQRGVSVSSAISALAKGRRISDFLIPTQLGGVGAKDRSRLGVEPRAVRAARRVAIDANSDAHEIPAVDVRKDSVCLRRPTAMSGDSFDGLNGTRSTVPSATVSMPTMSDDTKKSASPDYEVGFGRPPKAHQFKKGQSGNPNGRKKRRPSLGDVWLETVDELVPVREGGRSRRLPAVKVMLRQQRAAAMRGNLPATKFLLANYHQATLFKEDFDFSALSDEELEQLERIIVKANASERAKCGDKLDKPVDDKQSED